MNINLPPDEGKKKRSVYWSTCIVLGLVGWIFLMAFGGTGGRGMEAGGICGSLMCCFSLIFAISALSTPNDERRVVVIQKQPQYVPVVQQVIQQPVMQPRQAIQPMAPNNPPTISNTQALEWSKKARNLELARNWEDAAKAYEKAGMYSAAGRVRQENLEQTQPMVQIGQVGNTVLNDSVMITDGGPKTCPSCGKSVEATWKICPHCSSQL